MKKKSGNKKRRYLVITAIALASILFLAFIGAKAYLYINLLLGNDLVISIDSDKNNLFLKNGEEDEIKIKISSIANPFCTPICSSKFTDISDNILIEEDYFELRTQAPITKDFIISADTKGSGQNLYRFDIECRNIETSLCNTKEEIKSKSIIITLDHELNDKEIIIRKELGERLSSLANKENQISFELDEINKAFQDMNKTTILGTRDDKIHNSMEKMMDVKSNISKATELWNNNEISALNESLNSFELFFYDFLPEFSMLKEDFIMELSAYNNLTENITDMRKNFERYNNTKVNKETFDDAYIFMEDLNEFLSSIEKRDYIFSKESSFSMIYTKFEELSIMINEEKTNLDHQLDIAINESKLRPIIFDLYPGNFTFALDEPAPICCIFGKCEKCCDEQCRDDRDKYPIILVHGHSFNKKTSAEYSFDTFSSLQKKLENDGYVNAGSLYSISYDNITKSILGKSRNPFSFRVNYYFDILRTDEGNIITQTKTDSIDTYSIRLKGIIDNVKYKTNKDKVVIIAHSMGGLAARRYLQIFGSQDVDKVILIGTPNKGINDNVERICKLFGTEIECKDMHYRSLFINKINTATPEVPFYNIIGTGCSMGDEQGDGIVEEKNAYLEGAKNYYITGECDESRFDILHNNILNLDNHPEVYEIINNSLKEG